MFRLFLSLASLSLMIFLPVRPANAAPAEVYTGFLSSNAVGGYDVVSYFSEGKAAKGSKSFSTAWKDATWLFSSAEHRDLFAATPEKYAPQYGGYCAFAVAKNDLVSADPEAWKIVDGKLYLNYDKDIQKKWEMEQATFIELANKNWPTLTK